MRRGPGAALTFCLCLLLAAGAAAQEASPLPEGNAFMKSLLSDQREQDDAISDYTYDLLEVRENLDKNGIATSKTSLGYEVHYVKTRQVRRLVSRNFHPLSASEQAKEDRETAERARAIREGRVITEQAGVRLSRLFPSFDFQTLRRTELHGRSALELSFAPRKDLPREKAVVGIGDRLLKLLSGTVAIDEADRRVIRLDARSVGELDAKVATGVKLRTITFSLEFVPVEDGVWLPASIHTYVTGKAFFFRTIRVRQTSTYSNYRKFTVGTEEKSVG